MDRSLLAHLPIVLAVHRRGGFAAAAHELGMSPSAVSHAIQAVEAGLGQPLFARTTRSVHLTEAGASFVGVLGPALTDIAEAVDQLAADQGRISGTLRLNAPRTALPIAITPLLDELARRHPDLTVEITTDDGLADIVADGFDAGIRLGARRRRWPTWQATTASATASSPRARSTTGICATRGTTSPSR
jgi:DNA-binding transcriptional LysR family regulator